MNDKTKKGPTLTVKPKGPELDDPGTLGDSIQYPPPFSLATKIGIALIVFLVISNLLVHL